MPATVFGSSAVKPAKASKASAASRPQRAIGPTTSRVLPASGMTPAFGTKPKLGLMPTKPRADAGFWIDPPVSSAKPSTAMLAATAVAVPALPPPGSRSGTAAFRVGPAQLSLAWLPVAPSTGTLVLPRMTAPAARIRATTGESVAGLRSTPPVPLYNSDHPPVVGNPTMSIVSFTTTGTPANGPSASPAARRRPISRASASAPPLRKMTAL